MRQERLQFFRDLLQQRIAEMVNESAKTMAEMTIVDEHPSDVIDIASFQMDRNFELRIRDRERKLIAKMLEAIHFIDSGTYGICVSCGEEISEKRLMARPVTTMCIDCKNAQEKRERLGSIGGSRSIVHFSIEE